MTSMFQGRARIFRRHLSANNLPGFQIGFVCLALIAAGPTAAQKLEQAGGWHDIALYIGSGGRLKEKETRLLRKQIASYGADLPRQRKLMAALGVTLDPDRMNQPLPPPERNAAIEYQELTAALKENPIA